MAKYSNITNYNSVDGLPAKTYPMKVRPTTCNNCYEKVTEPVCPHCGEDVDIEFECDYNADEREYDKYDDV